VPAEPGYSQELIPSAFLKHYKNASVTEDSMMCLPKSIKQEEMTTLQQCFEDTANRLPDGNFLGTKAPTGNGEAEPRFEYLFCTYGQALDQVKRLARGCMQLGLVPDVQGEDGDPNPWRFMGIQAKNCKEWYLMHLAGFYSGATTVALYDTLGRDAMKYIINQVGMVTVTLSPDLAEGMINMKTSDTEGKTECLKNIITLGDIKPEVKEMADNAGISCYTYE
jgi:long-chain acyl-CoA synthetase